MPTSPTSSRACWIPNEQLCWPRTPEQKGSVENLVGWFKGSFFKQRRFVDDEAVLREWHEEVNAKRPSRVLTADALRRDLTVDT